MTFNSLNVGRVLVLNNPRSYRRAEEEEDTQVIHRRTSAWSCVVSARPLPGPGCGRSAHVPPPPWTWSLPESTPPTWPPPPPRPYSAPPPSRVIDNKHSNRVRSMTYLQGECSYRRAQEEEEEEEEKEDEEEEDNEEEEEAEVEEKEEEAAEAE